MKNRDKVSILEEENQRLRDKYSQLSLIIETTVCPECKLSLNA
jgi:hypothetical protein